MDNLCVNCKHHFRYGHSLRCSSPNLIKDTIYTLVDGSKDTNTCFYNRTVESACGKEGKYFERNVSTTEKVINRVKNGFKRV